MKVISLINMKGGVGKTTLSTNICDCLSTRSNKKVLLIDVDPQFNATQCVFSGDEYIEYLKAGGNTIIDVFEDSTRSIVSTVSGIAQDKPKELEEIQPYKFKKKYHILPGNLDLYKIDIPSGSGKEHRLKNYIKIISKKKEYDFVIIDTPPTPSVWMSSALMASDYYLIPVKPDPISFVGIDLLENVVLSKLNNYGLDIKCIGVVFTIVEREDSILYRTARRNIKKGKWADFVYTKYIPKRANIAKHQLDKQFILDMGDSTTKSSLVGIVNELEKRIAEDE